MQSETKVKKKRAIKEATKIEREPKIEMKVMLASVYDPEKIDPTGWFMSEKLDGVRCFWDGQSLYSRNGNKFYAPPYFIEGLPKGFQLDGELWKGRDEFQNCLSIVRRQDMNDEWKSVKYMIFDAQYAEY